MNTPKKAMVSVAVVAGGLLGACVDEGADEFGFAPVILEAHEDATERGLCGRGGTLASSPTPPETAEPLDLERTGSVNAESVPPSVTAGLGPDPTAVILEGWFVPLKGDPVPACTRESPVAGDLMWAPPRLNLASRIPRIDGMTAGPITIVFRVREESGETRVLIIKDTLLSYSV